MRLTGWREAVVSGVESFDWRDRLQSTAGKRRTLIVSFIFLQYLAIDVLDAWQAFLFFAVFW